MIIFVLFRLKNAGFQEIVLSRTEDKVYSCFQAWSENLEKQLLVSSITLGSAIPVVCVTNEREESVVNQHN